MRRRPAGGSGPARRRPTGDGGSVLLLVLGFTVVLLGMVVVVADVSVALLHQRAVASAADGAAVAAAQQIDEGAFYRDGLGERVPLRLADVRTAVSGYASDVEPATTLTGELEGPFTVVVRGSRAVQLPFSRFLGRGTVTVRSTARASSPVLG